jgi:hypothetical protein
MVLLRTMAQKGYLEARKCSTLLKLCWVSDLSESVSDFVPF